MARKRSKNSKTSFAGLGLRPEEDKKLIRLLAEHDSSASRLVRTLIRQWMSRMAPEY